MDEAQQPASDVILYRQRGEMPAPERWISKVVAWLPVYAEECGNAARVLLEDGTEHWFPVTAGWVYRQLAAHYMMDISALRRWYQHCMQLSQSPPIPVAPRDLSFFAVKSRSGPYGRNDGVIGYVSDAHVATVKSLTARTIQVQLTTGRELTLPMSRQMFEGQRMRARVFRHYLAGEGLL